MIGVNPLGKNMADTLSGPTDSVLFRTMGTNNDRYQNCSTKEQMLG